MVDQEQLMVEFQSLFYWITYSYHLVGAGVGAGAACFNPYFIGLPILIK